MMSRSSRRILACALFSSTAIASPALAQEASVAAFPVRQFPDENGVDLAAGAFTALTPSVSIGSEGMGLTYFREVRGGQFRDTMTWNIAVSGSTYTVAMGPRSEVFTLSNGLFTPVENNGSTLSLSGSTYTYGRADGTVATFMGGGPNIMFGNARGIVVLTVDYPSGRSLTFHYHEDNYTSERGNLVYGRRLQAVSTNAGYFIHFTYANDVFSSTGSGWATMTKVKGLNSATDSCVPQSFSCAQTGRPEQSIQVPQAGVYDYTDAEGRATRYTLSSGNVVAIRLPGSTSDDFTVSYLNSLVSSVTNRGVATGYSFADSNGIRTTTVTRPGGSTRVLTFDIAKKLLLSDKDELGRIRSYQYDSNNRLTRSTEPEGNYTQLTYDSRGNATETRQIAKSVGPSHIVAAASYPSTCTNPKTCNRPVSTTDPRGNVTDYTWDASHGGLLSVTAPAPTTGANRPQTRVSYSRLDANGNASSSGIIVPTGSSTCQTGVAPGCLGTANELKITIAYGYGLQPSSISRAAGNNSIVATQTAAYDAVGNLLTLDGPLSGTADTTRYRYNLNRELVGAVRPDPDGGGTLKHRATRLTYNSKGQLAKAERGMVNSQSDVDWANFSPAEAVEVVYDSYRRPTQQKLISGSTIHALTQSSYDARGRTDCVAIRMNPAAFGSLPASACTLGTEGGNGPDRITQTIYNNRNEVTEQRAAVGTTAAAAEGKMTWTDNGRLATLTDGENNKTSYEYDGHDRLLTTRFPVATKGANASSTTDYEQLTYDANGNIISKRLRNTSTIATSYDALNRPTSRNLPGSDPDTSYGYDNLGRLTSTNRSGHSLSFTWDALGRKLTEAGPHGTVSSVWDAAGRRTRLTYPGIGLYVLYDYLVTGEMTKVRENGATSGLGVLATYAYDDLGRQTSRTFGNGVVQTFTYDPVSRLKSLSNDLPGTSSDLGVSFAHNPASQINSTTRTGDSYAWTEHAAVTRNYTSNGLNQYTAATTVTFGYDANGNLTSSGSDSFGYDHLNRMTTATTAAGGSATLSYDALDRLYQTAGSTTTRFAHDGLDTIAEYNSSGTLLRRYVHGPSVDEPLVWYEGTGTTDRRFMSADERGSIVSLTNSSGGLIAINSYDEYGIPGSGNHGRFQYTGQQWLPEIGMYHYKARIYSPSLGRFLQTDPIGYGDGMNIYAYVRNDPVNFTDPLGLCLQPGTGSSTGGANGSTIVVTCPRRDPRGTGDGSGSGGGNIFVSIVVSRTPSAIPVPQIAEGSIDWGKLGQCLQNSALDHYGLLAATAASGAAATPLPKAIVPPFREIGTRTTNLLSIIGHYVEINVPRMLNSTNLFRIAGRANPYVFGIFLAADVAVISYDTYQCYKSSGD